MTTYTDPEGVQRYLDPGWVETEPGVWTEADDRVPEDAE